MAKKKKRPRRKWSKESVKESLRAYHEKGCPMRYGRMQKIDGGLVLAAVRRFGNWNNALREAGIPINTSRRWSKESVKNELRACRQEEGAMSYARIRKIDSRLASAAVWYFGSWNSALAEAGIPINHPTREWSKESVIKELRSHHEKSSVMTYKGMRKTDCGLLSAAVKRFGSWNNARAEAKIPIIPHGGKWSKELVKKELLARHSEGREMRESVMMKTDRALVYAARKYFGNWTKAIVEAGIPPEPPRRKWTREKALRELAAIMKRGESLKAAEVRKKHGALYTAANEFFKDFREAVESLGVDYSHYGKRRNWTKEEVVEEIKKLAAGDDLLTPKWVMENRLDLYMAAQKRFGGFKKAVDAAGVTPSGMSETASWTLEKVTRTIRARMEQGKDMDYAAVEKAEGTAFCEAVERHYGSWPEAVRAAREGLKMERTLKMMKEKGAGKRKDVARGKLRKKHRYNVTTR